MSNWMDSDWKHVLSRARAFLMWRGRSAQDAEDLVQEAWIRLAARAHTQEIEKPEALLVHIALNLSIDAFRASRSRGVEVSVEDVFLIDPAPSAERVVQGKERCSRLASGVKRLGANPRRALLAYRVEGMTYREIGERYGISASTVEKHVAKATKQLTEWMAGW